MKFLVLIFGSVASFFLLKYRREVKDFTGDISFAEKIFGMGGTNTFIVVFALLLFVGSLMYAFGTLDGLLEGIFGRFFGL